jgi:uncharacterized alkaline shock family protein YloU
MTDSGKTEGEDTALKEKEQQKIKTELISGKIRALLSRPEAVDKLSGGGLTGPAAKANTKAKKPVRAIRVALKDNTVSVDVHIVVVFGKPIPETARHIQREIKNLFNREFSFYHLRAVNVWADDVTFGEDAVKYRDQAIEQLRM